MGTATGIEWVEAREAAQHPPGHSPQQSVAVRRAVELRVRKADPDRTGSFGFTWGHARHANPWARAATSSPGDSAARSGVRPSCRKQHFLNSRLGELSIT